MQLRKNSNSSNLLTHNSNLCSTIIAIAFTSDPSSSNHSIRNEQFACQHSTKQFLPLVGSDAHLTILREALYDGRLISGETTIVNNLQTVSSIHGDDSLEETVVRLPLLSEEWIFQRVKNERHDSNEKRFRRHLADYSGMKKILVVKVTDVNGRFSTLLLLFVYSFKGTN
jgi:hypothetical protein